MKNGPHPKRLEALRLLNGMGWTDVDVAHVFGLTSTTIAKYRAANDIPVAKTKYTQRINHEEALSLLTSGMSDRQIARQLNVHQTSVLGWRRRHGLSPSYRSGNAMPAETRRGIKKMLAQGATKDAVAAKFNVHRRTVQKIRSKMNAEGLRKAAVSNERLRNALRGDKDLMAKLNSAIGEKVPSHIREHAVFDMYGDLFECVLRVEDIEKRAPSYRSAAYKMCGDEWSHSRLDKEDENGLTLMDTLSDSGWSPDESW
ncbi:MAG: helix-turn-helix domain-containing protein [Pseudomonadota bacterium]